MDILKIKGGKPLEGKVKAAGAKNAVTKLLVASLLSDKRCIFYNVPDIAEVEVTVELCREIGSEVQWDRSAGVLEIVTKNLKTSYVPQRFSGSNRIPILMIGALLGRTDEDIIVPTAGGCRIGKRPVDFHIIALEKLGLFCTGTSGNERSDHHPSLPVGRRDGKYNHGSSARQRHHRH
jgi:UDP-N-acetylglucosamine 1-carboxyvinyltransferase